MANIETLRSGLSCYAASDCHTLPVRQRRTCRRDAGFPSGPRGRGASALTNLQGSAQLTIFRFRLPQPLAYSGAQTGTSSSVRFRLTQPAAQDLGCASEILKMETMAEQCAELSPSGSNAIRTARSRSPGAYLVLV